MPDTPGQRDVIRERLLAFLSKRSYHYRPEKPFTLASGATIRAFTRIRSGVRGVPCTAIFTRADLDDRVQRGRNAAPAT